MLDLRLYLLQRLTAIVMAPLVIAHLALMIYAIQGGLTADEILSRTQGSMGWALFYSLFVVTVAINAAIGVRGIVYETVGVDGNALNVIGWAVFATLFGLGMYAVFAVIAAPGPA